MVTRAVTDDRYRVDPALARPERGRALAAFVFRVRYRGRTATLTVREGFVTDEFIDLARTEHRDAEQERRLDALKSEMADRILAQPAGAVYDADLVRPMSSATSRASFQEIPTRGGITCCWSTRTPSSTARAVRSGGAVSRAFAREGARCSSPAAPGPRSRRSPRRSALREERPRSRRSTPSTSRPSMSTPTPWRPTPGHRHLLQPDHASVHPRHADGRDVGRRLHGAGADRRADDVPDRAGGGPPHDPPGIRRDPRLRRSGDRSAPNRDYYLGGTQVAFDAIETMRRQLAVELGPHGIRFVTLASGGCPSRSPASSTVREAITEMIEAQTLLGRAATLEDVGNAAVFAASDWARSVTAAIVNVSCGTLID
jgi:hypothetical protein